MEPEHTHLMTDTPKKKRVARSKAVPPLIVRPFAARELTEQEVHDALAGGRENVAVCAMMQELEVWMGSLNAEGHRGVASASAGYLAVSEFYEKMKGLMQ